MTENRIIVSNTKSVGLSLILTFLFGSLGMLYSTILGAILMIVVEGILGFLTFGVALFITHPICMIWGAVAAHNYNKRLVNAAH
ncbi:hypothetical protein [Priestia koreensis]|uniref:Uncharacterized protein n=1 Tax=Priestia koreensis TaxID=284581 RepID=A0A0M0LHQ8_9BACI|nr:hypothetical protein [Priestia koreensis]KOO50501.1 hypothetical protein AMD01_01755 [Priestia koreensis]